LFLFAFTRINSQEIGITMRFRDILFPNLADTIEKVIPVKIYYADKWVDSLSLNVEAKNDSLSTMLERSFKNSGLTFFFSDNKLILSKGYNVKTNFAREYREYLKKNIFKYDTLTYIKQAPVNEQAHINEEFRIYRIGNSSRSSGTGTAVLSGIVTNHETGDPLAGVIIYAYRLKAGALTNSSGYYSLELPAGQYEIEYRMMGMRPTKRNIILYSNGSLDVGLVNTMNQLNEVIVSANRDNNVRNENMGIEKISMAMIKEIPMAMGEPDLLKSSLLLPGVQSVGEASGGYNIRGGSTDQNLILFDGAPIINPSHFFGFFTSFNSDIINDVTIYKSGMPARYGGRVSSVIDIDLREGSPDKVNVSGGISPFTGRLMVEGPIVKKKVTFIVSGRTTYSDWVLRSLNDARLRNSSAGFNDIQGLINYDFNKNNSISLSGYRSDDSFDYYKMYAIEYSNFSSTLRWKHSFNQQFSSQASLITSGYNYTLDSKKDSTTYSRMKYSLIQDIFRYDFTLHPNGNHKVDFGLDATYFSLMPGTQTPTGQYSLVVPKTLETERAFQPSFYLSDEYDITPNLLVSAGLRANLYYLFGPQTVFLYASDSPRSVESITDTLHYGSGRIVKSYTDLEYRFSMRYILGPELSVKVGCLSNYQYLDMISNTTSMSPIDIWMISGRYIRPQSGTQYSLGLYKNFRMNGIESSVEVYYKNMDNILEYKGGAQLLMNEHLETDILNGTGKAYGIELILKKKYGAITGWVSYTYSRVLYKVDGEFDEEKINNGSYFPADFDKPNDLKLITNFKLSRRINFTSNFAYSTGRPITFPVAFYDFYNEPSVYFSDRNAYRIPDYMRLDLAVTINGNLKAKKMNHSSFTFTVYNVLGRKNPYNVYFRVENGVVNGYEMSIFGQPIFMVTYSFRIRGNASTDF
jgi:hypothetical protein